MSDVITKSRDGVSEDAALRIAAEAELGKFLALAKSRADSGKGTSYMPGGLIDEVWHEMLKDPTRYAEFCATHCGQVMGHVPSAGFGTLEWVPDYEAQYGSLHAAWFADKSGRIDVENMTDYKRTGLYVTSWDCNPDSGENDHESPDGGTSS